MKKNGNNRKLQKEAKDRNLTRGELDKINMTTPRKPFAWVETDEMYKARTGLTFGVRTSRRNISRHRNT